MQGEIVQLGERQMRVDFQRKILLVIPVEMATNPTICMSVAQVIQLTIPGSYPIVPDTFESQRELQSGIKAMRLLMHRRDWSLSISTVPYAFIIRWAEVICIYFPLSLSEKVALIQILYPNTAYTGKPINVVHSTYQICCSICKTKWESGFRAQTSAPYSTQELKRLFIKMGSRRWYSTDLVTLIGHCEDEMKWCGAGTWGATKHSASIRYCVGMNKVE